MSKLRHFFLLLFLFTCTQVEARFQYKVSATAIFKNEARFLREWIEYHRLIGVEHFYLYNNNSDDDFMPILDPYITAGIVDFIDWPETYETIPEWTIIQCSAYEDAIKRAKKESKWLAILDIDEYIVPVKKDKLSNVPKEFENYGGVCVNWQLYGTSYVDRIGPNELMIEKLTLKAPAEYGENLFVKSIVQPKRVRSMRDPHFANYKRKHFQVNTNEQRLAGSIAPFVLTDTLVINHYWTKDEDFLHNVKVGRREAWSEGYANIMQRAENLNQIEDPIIQRFVPSLRKRMGL